MHARGGFEQDSLIDRSWSVVVDIVSISMMLRIASGLYGGSFRPPPLGLAGDPRRHPVVSRLHVEVVSHPAIGAMRLSTGERDDDRSVAVLHAAFDAGITLVDTADAPATMRRMPATTSG